MIKKNYKIKSYDCEYIASLGSYNSVKLFRCILLTNLALMKKEFDFNI